MWYDSKVVKNMECENKRRFTDGNAISEFNAKVQYFFYSTNFCSSFIVIYVFFSSQWPVFHVNCQIFHQIT